MFLYFSEFVLEIFRVGAGKSSSGMSSRLRTSGPSMGCVTFKVHGTGRMLGGV